MAERKILKYTYTQKEYEESPVMLGGIVAVRASAEARAMSTEAHRWVIVDMSHNLVRNKKKFFAVVTIEKQERLK